MEELDLTKESWARELLECPVCFDIPLPPIRLCVKGHIVCNNCRQRTKGRCPLCRNEYSETRNFVAEGIVSRVKVFCRNAGAGCDFNGRLGELGNHMNKICEFRPVQCYGCNDRLVEYSDFKRHLAIHHRLKVVRCKLDEEALGVFNVDTKNVEKRAWPQRWFKAFGQVFLIRLYYPTNSSGFSPSLNLWVSVFGPKSESKNYTASIEMCPRKSGSLGKGFRCVYKWTQDCPVNNFRDEAIQVIKDGGAMSIRISEIVLKSGLHFFTNVSGEWLFRIVIHKKSSLATLTPTTPKSVSPVSCPDEPSFQQLIKPAKLILPPSPFKSTFPTPFTKGVNQPNKPDPIMTST